ncbi:MAG: hypothetical protein JXR25_15420 [Pontiellaceae bacterium]|nr:hypothetical protein [Pontiellaceae bacterium]
MEEDGLRNKECPHEHRNHGCALGAENGRFDVLMGDLHYLGPVKPTGDFLRQAVVCDGEWVAILAWGPACYALRDRDDELASPATLCRMENEVQRDAVVAINALFVEQIICIDNA